ncbi:hypothetical protein GCM10011591_02670 [Nocardia camponoti]|uniref:Uncharacterized protein n=2 Tax=Nocardia camponoti TaxID=1616106 RepID=A0A917V466_9NOCA|nr:hypothetical protein GCM10011591_02670 [Nocardia camponoti]
MGEVPQVLSDRVAELQGALRRAVTAGDHSAARELRAELRAVDRGAHNTVARKPRTPNPARNHIANALTLLGHPATPKLITQVHNTFQKTPLNPARLHNLRRDEERAFRAAPQARPYFLCAALTVDSLTAARGLLALSTWPLEQRLVGPLTPRVHLLSMVTRLADKVSAHPSPEARRLLWQLAKTVPDVTGTPDTLDLQACKTAAQRELAVHREADARHREQARRAAEQLDAAAQLFGYRR